jgi:integrase
VPETGDLCVAIPAQLSALRLTDVATRPRGLLIAIRRSKTDPDGFGQLIGVVSGERRRTDPVAALMRWLDVRPAGAGPLFTRMHPDGTATREPIGARTVSRMIQARGRAAGLGELPITGHSLRAGHATTAAANGAAMDRIAAQTRHRDLETLVEHYIRPIDALANSTSRDLGL